jgi:hypothetical protein
VNESQIRTHLPLDERVYPAKFGCICSYGVEMHKEHTDSETNILLYLHRYLLHFIYNKEEDYLLKIATNDYKNAIEKVIF